MQVQVATLAGQLSGGNPSSELPTYTQKTHLQRIQYERLAMLTFFLVSIVIILHPEVIAAALPQSTPLHVDLDYAQFRYDDDQVYLEVYYATGEDQITYISKGDQFESALIFHVAVYPEGNDSVTVNRLWRVPHLVGDTTMLAPSHTVTGVLGHVIPREAHRLQISVIDEHNRSRRDTISFELPKKSFGPNSFILSDIELCSSIRKIPAETGNIFYKNTYEVIPNPGQIYGRSRPVLFYYAECYGLLTIGENGHYVLRESIYDSKNREVETNSRVRPVRFNSSVEVGTVNVGGLDTGSYDLVLTVTDSASNSSTQSTKRFYVYQPSELSENTLALLRESPYRSMSEAQMDEEFAMSGYIAGRAEQKQYGRITTISGKRMFMSNFWKNRDLSPVTPINEFKDEYFRRLAYAIPKFRAGSRAGWKTDRGRAFILYGQPDQITSYRHEIDSKPYEIWRYEQIQGGVIFIFMDRTGFNDYYLVHSTARNEFYNPEWEDQLRPGR